MQLPTRLPLEPAKPQAAEATPTGLASGGQASAGLAVTDGELLRLFTRHGDAAAFERLLERHGEMVWRVCRVTLRRQQDAEDAFQATFLILARSARQIGESDSAAGWLYRVAHRTSLRARKRLARRREEALALDPAAPPEEEFPDLWRRRLASVLAEELMALPLKYQTPLVMRYLEGQSRRAIAEATDSTIQTVQGRLAQGKRLLRRRMVRRGVTLATAMAAMSAPKANASQAADAVSPHVFTQTLSSATTLTTGGALAASAAVVSLYREGLRTMFLTSLTKPTLAAAACGLAAIALLAPATEPTVQPTEGVVLSAAVAEEEVEVADAAPVELAANNGEPEALAPGVEVAGKAASSKAMIVLLNSEVDLAEAEKRWIDDMRRVYARMAEEEGGDYEQPGFEELLKLERFWIHRNSLTLEKKKNLNARGALMSRETSQEAQDQWKEESNQNIAEWNLAQAKLAEVKRQLKRAAVLETEQLAAKEARKAAGGAAGSPSSAEAGARVPLLDEPAVAPAAAPAQDKIAEIEKRLREVKERNRRGVQLIEKAKTLFMNGRDWSNLRVPTVGYPDERPAPSWAEIEALAKPKRLEIELWSEGNAVLAKAVSDFERLKDECADLQQSFEDSEADLDQTERIATLVLGIGELKAIPVADYGDFGDYGSVDDTFLAIADDRSVEDTFLGILVDHLASQFDWSSLVDDPTSTLGGGLFYRNRLGNFQEAQGVARTGRLDEPTWNALLDIESAKRGAAGSRSSAEAGAETPPPEKPAGTPGE